MNVSDTCAVCASKTAAQCVPASHIASVLSRRHVLGEELVNACVAAFMLQYTTITRPCQRHGYILDSGPIHDALDGYVVTGNPYVSSGTTTTGHKRK